MQTTFPRLMLEHAAKARPDAPALREKEYGIWQTPVWAELAHAGARAGLRAGRRPACSAASTSWWWPKTGRACTRRMLAAQSLGAVPVPLYQDAAANEYVFPINNAEVAIRGGRGPGAGRQDARTARVLPAAGTHLVRRPARPAQLRRAGAGVAGCAGRGRARATNGQHPRFFDAAGRAGPAGRRGRDVLHLGHHRQPQGRGAHALHAARPRPGRRQASTSSTANEEVLAYLPPAWIGQNIFSYAQWLACGYVVNCPESAGTVTIDLKEIGPTYYFAPPRVFEGLLTDGDDPHGGRRAPQEVAVPALHGAGAARRPGADGRQAGGRAGPAALRARQPVHLRPAAQHAGHLAACAWPTPRARPSGPTCSPSTARSAST